MADNNTKKAAKKAPKRPSVPDNALVGVIRTFEGPVPPAFGRATYPWATIQPHECFDLPAGSRSCVSQQAKKHGRILEVRDNSPIPGCVTVYCSGLVQTTTTNT